MKSFSKPKRPRLKKRKGGRPSSITEVVLKKLEEAFALGCTDREAALLADITPATMYNYQTRNPEFVERKEVLRQSPILLARRTVVEALSGDPYLALKYLERKRKDEFGLRQEMTGKEGRPVVVLSTTVAEALAKVYGAPHGSKE